MKSILQILLFFFVFCEHISAQNYACGARFIGLSNASVSLSDTWSTFHNQATVAPFKEFSAGVFYESRFMVDELSLAAISTILPSNSGNFGFSLYQFGHGTFKEHKLGLAYARQLSKIIMAALQLDYFSQQFPENEKTIGFPTFEVGFSFKVTKFLNLGVHIFNPIENGFKSNAGEQKFPAIYRFGGHYQFSDMVLIATEIQKTTHLPLLVKTGIEFSPINDLLLRLGVSGKPVQLSSGIGYQFGRIRSDISFSHHANLGFTPSISVQFIAK